ncbi:MULTISPECIES: hypothetical protein [Falsihalocynthiibacter]|uniref:hypothetical protein n=1 Tax=Falsihalocynthiibacter TaxID=2854182 RepID=UPI00300286A8
MENDPIMRRDIRLIDCLCKSRRGLTGGTGAIRGAILTIAIGIAFLARLMTVVPMFAASAQEIGLCAMTLVFGAA